MVEVKCNTKTVLFNWWDLRLAKEIGLQMKLSGKLKADNARCDGLVCVGLHNVYFLNLETSSLETFSISEMKTNENEKIRFRAFCTIDGTG